MSDVRALLRSERAIRRISHPHAKYSASGSLSCRVCRLPLKAESLWDLHVRSKQHKINSQKYAEQEQADASTVMATTTATTTEAAAPAPAPALEIVSADIDLAASGSRKRKASFEERGGDELPKAQKLGQLSRPISEDAREEINERLNIRSGKDISSPETREEPLSKDTMSLVNGQPRPQQSEDKVNEDEWEAFEREVASLPLQQNGTVAAVSSAATIEAKPLSAEEIAAQAREEQSRQREMKEAEMEEEKEDATRKLEDELDEMEELELRVKRLRDKREAIRRAKDMVPALVDDSVSIQQQSSERILRDDSTLQSAEESVSASTDEESDEEDWDAWRLR